MPNSTAQTSDLKEAVGYEISALEYLRAILLGQNETSSGSISLTLGDHTEDGMQRVRMSLSGTINLSESAVRTALHQLRPLAFSAAFKVQDMIVEWMLRANGINEWTFSKKLAAYDEIRTSGILFEPPIFSDRPLFARAFWELYRFFVPFRGTVVHSGGLALRKDGTIEVTKGNQTLNLSSHEQGSYMRLMCILTKHLIGQIDLNPFLEAILEKDFINLEPYHGQSGFTIRSVHLENLKVTVPSSYVLSLQPLTVRIDFDQLRQVIEERCGVGVRGLLYFSVSIFVASDGRETVWELPIEDVPSGIVTFQEGDAHYDQFLHVTIA